MDFLPKQIDAENVLKLIQYCIDFEVDKKLMKNCKQFLRFHTNDVLNSEAFIHASRKCLAVLLKQHFINVSEVDLFNAVSSFIYFFFYFIFTTYI